MTSMPDKPRDPLIGVTLDGRFLVEELIGSGGMSNVYRATQLRVNRDVAVKTLKVQVDQPVYRERFQREVDLLCTLSHPNIVTVYDCLLGPDGQPCVVMDYLRGRSLEQLLVDEGPLSTDRFATIFVQVLSALEHAHKKGVIHRDIKPGNIVMLDRETDFIKVVDFGLAKFNQESRRLTHTGELWGSPPYMSPEQCMGKPDNERSDIYSVGIVMYEMLTGKDPYHHATSIFELIQCHVNRPPPALRDINPFIKVPAKLEEVLFKAIAKDSESRYQTANTLKEDVVSACLTASDPSSKGVAAWAAAGGSISSGGQSGTTFDTNSQQSDSPWYNGYPGTTSGANTSIGIGDSTAGDISGGTEPADRPAQSVSPWSREGASRADSKGSGQTSSQGLASSFNSSSGQRLTGGADPHKLATSGAFGSAKPPEECTICGKPIQKQRRGSMTAWILADHHKVMEKISGFCECSIAGASTAVETQKPPAARPAESGDTALLMAKMVARSDSKQTEASSSGQSDRSFVNAGASVEPLFDDPNKRNNQAAMRYNSDRVTAANDMGNKTVMVFVALVLIGGLVFGVMKLVDSGLMFGAKKMSESAKGTAEATLSNRTSTAPVESKPADAPDASSNTPRSRDDDVKPVRKPEPSRKFSIKRPPKPAVSKSRVNAPAKVKQPLKPKVDQWDALYNARSKSK